MFEKCGRTTVDDGRRTPDHGYTLSSPCEPEGSSELINMIIFATTLLLTFFGSNVLLTKDTTFGSNILLTKDTTRKFS